MNHSADPKVLEYAARAMLGRDMEAVHLTYETDTNAGDIHVRAYAYVGEPGSLVKAPLPGLHLESGFMFAHRYDGSVILDRMRAWVGELRAAMHANQTALWWQWRIRQRRIDRSYQ